MKVRTCPSDPSALFGDFLRFLLKKISFEYPLLSRPIPFRLYTFRPCPASRHPSASLSLPSSLCRAEVTVFATGILACSDAILLICAHAPRTCQTGTLSVFHPFGWGSHFNVPLQLQTAILLAFHFTFISHLDLIFIPQRCNPTGPELALPGGEPLSCWETRWAPSLQLLAHSLSRCLMPSCLPAWQSSFTPSARGP